MEDDFLLSFAGFGIEFGVRMLNDVFGSTPDDETVSEQVVECSARQAAYIVKALGLAHHVDEELFGRIVGVIAGSTSTLITELTGQDVPLSDDAVPNATHICMRAYGAMRR